MAEKLKCRMVVRYAEGNCIAYVCECPSPDAEPKAFMETAARTSKRCLECERGDAVEVEWHKLVDGGISPDTLIVALSPRDLGLATYDDVRYGDEPYDFPPKSPLAVAID